LGIGFVLLVWFLIGAVVAAVAAAVLAVLAYVAGRRRRRRVRLWVIAFAATPFLFLVYLFVAFGGYALWCETYRGVDPGLGDSPRVPLQNGYVFHAIDTFDQSFIELAGGEQKHFGLARIGQSGDFIFGSEPSGFFLINTRTRSDTLFSSEKEFRQALVRSSRVTSVAVEDPSTFYSRHRWSVQDTIAFAVMLAPPITLFVFQLVLFFRWLALTPSVISVSLW
jgi:hypothetical protein